MEGEKTLFTQDDTGNYVEYTPPEPPAFIETLPEDLRESEHLKEIKDSSELAKSYVDLKSNQVKPPESADGYSFQKPDGYDVDEDTLKAFKQTAFENGINQKQFEAIIQADASRWQKSLKAIEDSIEANHLEAEKALKAEWGNSYDAKVESAKRVLNHEKLADADFKKFLEDTRFGDNPQVIKFFARIAEAISEDTFLKPGKGAQPEGPRLNEAGQPMLRFPSMEGKG